MYPWTINLQLFADEPDDANPGGEEGVTGEDKPAEKLIPQSEVDRIVQERLSRERKKHEPFSQFVERQAKKHGLDPEAYLREVERQEALASVKDEADTKGVDPETLLELKRTKERLAELERKEADERAREAATKTQQAEFAKQVADFNATYPSVDVAKLAENADFMEFVKDLNPNLTLIKMYERYVRFNEAEKLAKKATTDANASRSTSSGRDTNSGGVDYGLTANQKQLAKENGMTEAEYAELHKQYKRRK
jgi:hypothetical protein